METENDLQKPQKPTKKINMGYIFGIVKVDDVSVCFHLHTSF